MNGSIVALIEYDYECESKLTSEIHRFLGSVVNEYSKLNMNEDKTKKTF